MIEKPLDIILPVALSFFAFLVILVTVILFMYYARRKVFAQKIELINLKLKTQKHLINSMIEVQELERARISRDLHDAFSSNLSAISLNLQHLRIKSKDELTREICDLATEGCLAMIDKSRRISHNLMPIEMEHIGLLETLIRLCREFSKSEQLDVHFNYTISEKHLKFIKRENQIHVYRIIQELITNSIKHGNATKIELNLTDYDSKMLEFHYHDNGVGTDLNVEEIHKGLGIQNINYRAEIIGGRISFNSALNEGFNFSLKIPVHETKN